MQPGRLILSGALAAAAIALSAPTCGGSGHESPGHRLFEGPQSNPVALSPDGSQLFVASTTSNQVDILDTESLTLTDRVAVGVEPVGLAAHPSGDELWVSNHVSDSVSVVDVDPESPTRGQVIRTIQAIDPAGVSDFDEPVGIVFAQGGAKAYVALSSSNRIAVIDTASYAISGHLAISAQDPRALAVGPAGPGPSAPELLFVAAFESGNQTEISACATIDGSDQCTLDLFDFISFNFSPDAPGSGAEHRGRSGPSGSRPLRL